VAINQNPAAADLASRGGILAVCITLAEWAGPAAFVLLFFFFGLFLNRLFAAVMITQACVRNSANASGQNKCNHYFFHTEWFYTLKGTIIFARQRNF
jgi:hypothetical protein